MHSGAVDCRENREKPPTKQGVYAEEAGSFCRGNENGAAAPYIKSARSAYQERPLKYLNLLTFTSLWPHNGYVAKVRKSEHNTK